MKPSHVQWLKRLPALFEIPAPDPPRLLRRINIRGKLRAHGAMRAAAQGLGGGSRIKAGSFLAAWAASATRIHFVLEGLVRQHWNSAKVS